MIQAAYEALVEMETADFEATWSALRLSQRTVLKALALESTAVLPYSREFLERYHLTIGGTQRVIRTLLSLDLVEKHEAGKCRLTDPLMGNWLARG